MSRPNQIQKVIIAFTLLGTLAACGGTTPRIVEKPILVDRPALIVQQPVPADQMPIEWLVVTKDNFEEKVKELEAQGDQVVIIGLTTQGYQNLSVNIADLRRYIQQQNSVIAAYKKYYEPSEKPQEKQQEEKKEEKSFWRIW